MKKIYLVVQKKDMVSALEELRDLGVVHVEHQKDLISTQIADLNERIKTLEEASNILAQYPKDDNQQACSNWRDIANTTIKLQSKADQLKDSMNKRKQLIAQWEDWGDFNLKDLRDLSKNGVYLTLAQFSVKKTVELPEGVMSEVIGIKAGIKRCVLISREAHDYAFETLELPAHSLSEMREMLRHDETELTLMENKLQAMTVYVNCLREAQSERRQSLEFEEVVTGMRDELGGKLTVLKGFLPAEEVEGFSQAAQKHRWGVVVEDVEEDDQPPTLLKNPKWVELIKPVLDIVEILPGYKEFDVSRIFLLFFSLFFAMLIGDAGYGMIFLILTVVFHFKKGKQVQNKAPFILSYWLNGLTILWGILTGTFFGQQWLPATVKPLLPWLNDAQNIQQFCFVVALIHLSIARIWSAVKKMPSITSLSDVGWLLIVWGMFFVANMFVLSKPFPSFGMYFFYLGIPLALFFMVEPKRLPKVIGLELVPFILNVISAGTDLVSYIRLFAVGLATVAVADATNAMAAQAPLAVAL
ncbi:MAG: hypothetical protein KC713_00640, partial [Candidatus Omnitrophica bacterium]|nr:hypothetical protein [Candidatus Omnitrophota bacterium]